MWKDKKYVIGILILLLLILVGILIFFQTSRSNVDFKISEENKKKEYEKDIGILTYTIKQGGRNPKLLIVAESSDGIEYIEKPDGDIIYGNEKNKIGIDYDVQWNTPYPFKIKEKDKGEVTETIILDDIITIVLNDYEVENKKYTFPNLEIINPKNKEIKTVMIQFTSAVTTGDTINLNTATGVTVQKTSGYAIAKVSGLNTQQIEEYLKNNLSITRNSDNVDIKVILSDQEINKALNYLGKTGHYYEYVSSSGITWLNAKTQA